MWENELFFILMLYGTFLVHLSLWVQLKAYIMATLIIGICTCTWYVLIHFFFLYPCFFIQTSCFPLAQSCLHFFFLFSFYSFPSFFSPSPFPSSFFFLTSFFPIHNMYCTFSLYFQFLTSKRERNI